MLEVEKTYKFDEAITIKCIQNTTYFMLDSRYGTQYNLTELEFLILDGIKGGKSFLDIKHEILKNYNVSDDEVYNDLLEYVGQLLDNKIIYEKD